MGYRQQVHIKIDTHTYIQLKQKNVNISQLVRKILISYVETEVQETTKDKLIKDREKKKQELQKIQQDISLIDLRIFELEEEDIKERKKKLEEAERMVDGANLSGLKEDLI